MRAQAQRSSAANRDGSADRGSVFGRRDAATRASSRNSDGSGAPSRRRRRLTAAVLAAAALVVLVVPASAFASKEAIDWFDTLGGQFTQPRDIAVNSTGNGPADAGDIYVVDDSHHRIERFDADGGFISAWGANVTHRDEVQTVAVVASGGTYTLTFDGSTTDPISYNAFPSTVDDALDSLPSIGGDANVTVSGTATSGFTVTFTGALAGIDFPQMTADISSLTGDSPAVNIATVENGSGGGGTDYEVCAVASECASAVATGGNGTTAGNGAMDNPQSVAVDGDTGNVFVADRDNRRINVYDGAGAFIASYGFAVNATVAGTGYEVCPATDVCQAGTGGSGIGQVGTGGTGGTYGIAVSAPDGNAATGSVFLANTQNRRVETYDLDGGNPANFGSASEFGATQPRMIDVDSRGIVYASDSEDGAEVERYDSENANGGGTVFLEPIQAAVNETQTVTFDSIDNTRRFTLTCPNGEETGLIAYGNFAPQNIENALEAKCGADSFSVTGSGSTEPYVVTFEGAFAATDVPTMTCTSKTSQNNDSCSISQEIDGHTGPLLNATSTADATSGLAVDPDTDGAGSDTDLLQVLRNPLQGNTAVQQFGPVNAPGLATAPTAIDDTHGSEAGFSTVDGLGLDDGSGRLFVTATDDVSGIGFGSRVYILDDPTSIPAPVVSMDPVTVKTDTTADLAGTVDPQGSPVSCRFQYSIDEIEWTDVEEADAGNQTDCASLAPGPQPVSQQATGLDPNTRYFVRLLVSRPLAPASAVVSEVEEFDTDEVPPVISDVGAINVGDTSVRMVGTIDPRNSETSYVFEYGTTSALGSFTDPVDIGGGTTPITVHQVVGGLNPDTTYHFKLTATNGAGPSDSDVKTFHTRTDPLPPAGPGNCPNQEVREAQGSAALPDCRAYEMVSPPDKNQGGVDQFFWSTYMQGFARDGNAAAFCTNALFGEPAGNIQTFCAPYVSRRGPQGWTTTAPFPRHCLNDRAGNNNERTWVFLDPYFERAVASVFESSACPIPFIDPTAPDESNNLYLQDLTTDPHGFTRISVNPVNISAGDTLDQPFIGAADDFSHIFYVSDENQTEPPDSPAPGGFHKIYEWVREGEGACAIAGGCLRLVSKNLAGEPFATASGPVSNSNNGNNATSADGERIYFTNGGHLYMREGGATTVDVSAPECAVPADCGPDQSRDEFLWASPDGDVAFFLSCDKLTDESAASSSCPTVVQHSTQADPKLYRWDRNAPAGERLTDLSVDAEPADGGQPDALAMIGGRAGADGDIVYFVAAGQIVSGEPTDTDYKLYRWQWNGGSPTVDFLAPYESFGPNIFLDDETWGQVNTTGGVTGDINASENGTRSIRVTADGEHLMLTTRLKLDPASDRDGHIDAYRWSEDSGWICASCQLPGAPSAGHVDPIRPSDSDQAMKRGQPYHQISDDGKRIFFTAMDALVPEDTNGDEGCPRVRLANNTGRVFSCQDVYMWHDGAVRLITTGKGTQAFVPLGATASGDNVFFMTTQRLVGWDVDSGADIYTARVDGGFAEPPPEPAQCEGEACRQGGTSPPPAAGAGTAVFRGPGNSPQPPRRDCGPTAKRAKQASRTAKRVRRRAKRSDSAELRKRSKKIARKAHRLSRTTQRCRRANRRASR